MLENPRDPTTQENSSGEKQQQDGNWIWGGEAKLYLITTITYKLVLILKKCKLNPIKSNNWPKE